MFYVRKTLSSDKSWLQEKDMLKSNLNLKLPSAHLEKGIKEHLNMKYSFSKEI